MRRTWIFVAVAMTVTLIALIALTAVLVPALNPAYTMAEGFVDDVLLRHDEAAAAGVLTPEMAAWVAENCPQGVVACVDAYTPDEWGNFVDAVYRRSVPDGANAWDILIIGTFDQKLTAGFSGVCVYLRAERSDPSAEGESAWRVARWSGWVSCGNELADLEQLRTNADAPNRAP